MQKVLKLLQPIVVEKLKKQHIVHGTKELRCVRQKHLRNHSHPTILHVSRYQQNQSVIALHTTILKIWIVTINYQVAVHSKLHAYSKMEGAKVRSKKKNK